MEINQDTQGCFHLRNGIRSIKLTFEQVEWILQDFYDLDFDINLAKQYYGTNP